MPVFPGTSQNEYTFTHKMEKGAHTRPLLIYEDIDIGKVIDKKISRIYAFPLRIAGMDASPVNMVAEVE